MMRPSLVKSVLGYSAAGDPTSNTSPKGVVSSYSSDENGNRTASFEPVTVDGIQYQIVDGATFDPNENQTGTSRTQVTASGTPQEATNNLSSTSATYNALNQETSSFGELGNASQTTYDSRGQVIETRSEAHDESGTAQWLIVRTVYDAAGRVAVETDQYQDGSTAPIWATAYSYDADGRAFQTRRLKDVQVTFDGTPDAYVSVLSNPGAIISTSTTSYDALGRVSSTTNEYGLETLYTYNSVDELVETRTQNYDHTGTLVWRVTRTVYDKYGRDVVTTDPFLMSADGNDALLTPVIMGTQSVYDSFGTLIESDRLQGVVISLTSGEASVTTPGTVISSSKTSYNSQGQVAQTIDPAGRTVDFEYDKSGRQTATVDSPLPVAEVGLAGYAAGTMARLRTETTYDDHGPHGDETTNIREIIAPDATVTDDYSAAQTTTYIYDQLGNLIQTIVPNPDGSGPLTNPTTSAAFDALGRETSETNQIDQTRSFQYEADGRLARCCRRRSPIPRTTTHRLNLRTDILTTRSGARYNSRIRWRERRK